MSTTARTNWLMPAAVSVAYTAARMGLWGAVVAAAFACLPACDITISSDACPALSELCPSLQCNTYAQNDGGCDICACADDAAPQSCFDDASCPAGSVCDTVNYCLPPPDCEPGTACDTVCFGMCTPSAKVCASDGECGGGSSCAFFDNPRQSDGSGYAPPAGVCVPNGCDNSVALPSCPPGSSLTIDFSENPCGQPICVADDWCRDIPVEYCTNDIGCTLIGGGGSTCDPTRTDCSAEQPVEELRCASIDDCGWLPIELCETNAACRVAAVDDPSCMVCDPLGNCEPCGANGDQQRICVPRLNDSGACISDTDCFPGEACEVVQQCGQGCTINANGEQVCVDACWADSGTCVSVPTRCADLLPDQCNAAFACVLVDGVACADRGAVVCAVDQDCGDGAHCEIRESCPGCADPLDVNCAAPCYVEGYCVTGAPAPPSCSLDSDCGYGERCTVFDVCPVCDVANGPCPDCVAQSYCAAIEQLCVTDADCGGNALCDRGATTCAGAPLLSDGSCPGVCTGVDPSSTLCQVDTDCPTKSVCAVSDTCLPNSSDPNGGCWSVCVER